jgi:primosomal replication protein N
MAAEQRHAGYYLCLELIWKKLQFERENTCGKWLEMKVELSGADKSCDEKDCVVCRASFLAVVGLLRPRSHDNSALNLVITSYGIFLVLYVTLQKSR